jgi:hypothetical protein
MSDDHTRSWLINASGAAILSNALMSAPTHQGAGRPTAKTTRDAELALVKGLEMSAWGHWQHF